ncbi:MULTISPECIES: hypothetical protein [unclassified Frankia]|uniref:hypothetical protein n=1 Tax=unclassified Frankia TaxID=2632575 RepID=UPI0020248E1D
MPAIVFEPWVDDADTVDVGVLTRLGPHVTPQIFDVDDPHLLLVAPRSSVKIRALRRDDRMSVLIRAGTKFLAASGYASIVDPLSPVDLLSPGRLLRAPTTVVSFIGRNNRHLTGMAADLGLRTATLPTSRVLVELDVVRTIETTSGGGIVAAGDWPEANLLLTGTPETRITPPAGPWSADERRILDELLEHARPVSVGLRTAAGPVVLPGTWEPDTALVRVPAALARLVGVTSGAPVSVTAHTGGHRLDSKRGVLLRGEGEIRRDGTDMLLGIRNSRATVWRGDRSRTVRSESSSAREPQP